MQHRLGHRFRWTKTEECRIRARTFKFGPFFYGIREILVFLIRIALHRCFCCCCLVSPNSQCSDVPGNSILDWEFPVILREFLPGNWEFSRNLENFHHFSSSSRDIFWNSREFLPRNWKREFPVQTLVMLRLNSVEYLCRNQIIVVSASFLRQ